MGWFAQRRARRAFMARLRITELEKANGLELSYPDLGLPTITVVSNPNGYSWEPWIAVGFPPFSPTTSAGSRRMCVARAKERLWQIALARSEEPVEVHL